MIPYNHGPELYFPQPGILLGKVREPHLLPLLRSASPLVRIPRHPLPNRPCFHRARDNIHCQCLAAQAGEDEKQIGSGQVTQMSSGLVSTPVR